MHQKQRQFLVLAAHMDRSLDKPDELSEKARLKVQRERLAEHAASTVTRLRERYR